MVLHIYHAEVNGVAFDTELDIPDPEDKLSFAVAVRSHIDEVNESIFNHVKPLKCQSCGTRDAITFLHHPMLFLEVEPPRVEDLLSPVCCRATCSMQAHQEIELALAQQAAYAVLNPNKIGEVLVCCASCSKPATHDEPLQQCSRCKSVRYCGSACQRAHWPKHKVMCQRD